MNQNLPLYYRVALLELHLTEGQKIKSVQIAMASEAKLNVLMCEFNLRPLDLLT